MAKRDTSGLDRSSTPKNYLARMVKRERI